MSKSLGNAVDPLELMDTYGTDALRFTLLTGSTPGNDMNLSLSRVESSRNLTNKLWNAARFAIMSLDRVPREAAGEAKPWLVDRWISSRLAEVTETANRLFEGYQFGEAGRQLYDFFWGEFADWYIEASKVAISAGGGAALAAGQTLVLVLDRALRLLHPFIPFVTEEVWQNLRGACADRPELAPTGGWEEALIIARWPEAGGERDRAAEADFGLLMELIRGIRNARAESGVEPGRRITALMAAGKHAGMLAEQRELLAWLARLDGETLAIERSLPAPEGAVTLALGEVSCYLPLAGMVDLAEERGRLQRELAELDAQIERSEGLLAGPFAARAPEAIVARERARLGELRATRETVVQQLGTTDDTGG
jgi:valyl-tRNA synthetase